MHKFLLFFIALLITGCGSSSSRDNTRTLEYPYSTNYDTSQESAKAHPLLVIRLDYANQQFVHDESSWAAKIFGNQSSQLNHYMDEVSNGQFQYSPVAEGGGDNDGVLTVLFSSDHPNPNIDYDSQYHPDLMDAITAVSDYGFDFSLYDDNGDGALSSNELLIMFIMAGEEDAYSGGSSGNGIWAHQYCTTSQYTPTVNGVNVMGCAESGNYAIFGERHHDTTTISHDASIGIIAHELGHSALNLPDLYDVFNRSAGIGAFGIMATGSWGQAHFTDKPGQTPSHFSAWSKADIGWFTPELYSNTANENATLNASHLSTYNILKVPITPTEYFLLENRSVDGYDEGIKELVTGTYIGGVAIWHIDEDIINAKRPNNSVNGDENHKGVDLEEAENPVMDANSMNFGDAKNLYYNGNETALTPTSTPSSDGYSASGTGIFIENTTAPSNTMTLDITNPN